MVLSDAAAPRCTGRIQPNLERAPSRRQQDSGRVRARKAVILARRVRCAVSSNASGKTFRTGKHNEKKARRRCDRNMHDSDSVIRADIARQGPSIDSTTTALPYCIHYKPDCISSESPNSTSLAASRLSKPSRASHYHAVRALPSCVDRRSCVLCYCSR